MTEVSFQSVLKENLDLRRIKSIKYAVIIIDSIKWDITTSNAMKTH